MALVVWLAPVTFSACAPGSWWCGIAYALTGSAGKTGSLFLILITCIFYASTAPTLKAKAGVFLRSLVSLAVFFGVLAFVNEHYTKNIWKAQRPSHVYMLSQTGLGRTIDSLYQLDQAGRQQFFSGLIKNNPSAFSRIAPEIQAHWIDEPGFSFPSGHTFNAFLFAMILAYAIYFNRSRPGWRSLYIIPFIWAAGVGVSRVAIGAHTALDVSAGAALGLLTGSLFLYVDVTRRWLTRKE